MLISWLQTACVSSLALDQHFYWFLASVSDGFIIQRLNHRGPLRISVEILIVHILGQFAPWNNVSNHKLGSPWILHPSSSNKCRFILEFVLIVESDLDLSGKKKTKEKVETVETRDLYGSINECTPVWRRNLNVLQLTKSSNTDGRQTNYKLHKQSSTQRPPQPHTTEEARRGQRKVAWKKPGKKKRTHDWRPDDVSRNIKIEMAISVISNQSVDEESESDSRGGFLQIAQGKGRESVT